MDVKIYIKRINKLNEKEIEILSSFFPNKYKDALNIQNETSSLEKLNSLLLFHHFFPNLKEGDISYNLYGKPYIKGGYFNISHDKEYVVIGMSEYELGVDICHFTNNKQISAFLFNEEENFILKDSNDYEFSKIWAMKEATIKLIGKGLLINLKEININNFYNNLPIIYNNTEIYNRTLKFKDYYISVSTYQNIDKIIVEEIL